MILSETKFSTEIQGNTSEIKKLQVNLSYWRYHKIHIHEYEIKIMPGTGLYIATNKARQRSTIANVRSMTTHIYHLMIIVTGGFSKKSLLLLLYFPRNLLTDLEFLFLEFKHFYKIHRTSLFICSFFTWCFIIILCIKAVRLFVLFHFV